MNKLIKNDKDTINQGEYSLLEKYNSGMQNNYDFNEESSKYTQLHGYIDRKYTKKRIMERRRKNKEKEEKLIESIFDIIYSREEINEHDYGKISLLHKKLSNNKTYLDAYYDKISNKYVLKEEINQKSFSSLQFRGLNNKLYHIIDGKYVLINH